MRCILALLCFLLLPFISIAQDEIVFRSNPEKSILRNTADSNNHKILLAAMKSSKMEAALSYEGPYTVFAPSDVAFEKLTRSKFEDLLNPVNKKNLNNLLTYHIVAGNISASKILLEMCRGNGKAIFTTVQGDFITTTMNGTDIILTDSHGNTAKIILADSNQCNGVIHEIDSVMLPPKFNALTLITEVQHSIPL